MKTDKSLFQRNPYQFISSGDYPVLRAVGNGNYTDLFTAKDHILYSITLSEVCQRFPYLIRLHKQCAVHPEHIKAVYHDPRNKRAVIVTKTDEEMAVSRRQIPAILDLLTANGHTVLTRAL